MLLRILEKIDLGVGRLCASLLFLAVLLMITLTLANIAFRFLVIPVFWIEPAVRQLVFAVAFLGGSVATASKQHIAIDIIGQVTRSFHLHKVQRWIDVIVYLFCISTLIWLSYAGYLLVDQEREFGKEQFLGIHSSTLAMIVPLGTLLVAFRFFNLLMKTIFGSKNTLSETGPQGPHDSLFAQKEAQ